MSGPKFLVVSPLPQVSPASKDDFYLQILSPHSLQQAYIEIDTEQIPCLHSTTLVEVITPESRIGHDGKFKKGRRRYVSLLRDHQFFPVFSLYHVNKNSAWRMSSLSHPASLNFCVCSPSIPIVMVVYIYAPRKCASTCDVYRSFRWNHREVGQSSQGVGVSSSS